MGAWSERPWAARTFKKSRTFSLVSRPTIWPLLTIGMTPSWAAANCQHYSDGQEWGDQTCPAKDTSASGPWGQYVTFLAKRYAGRQRGC